MTVSEVTAYIKKQIAAKEDIAVIQPHQLLFDEISKLPLEKVGKALSFIRYLKQEQDHELMIDPFEEAELLELLQTGETIEASELLAKIEALPDDKI